MKRKIKLEKSNKNAIRDKLVRKKIAKLQIIKLDSRS